MDYTLEVIPKPQLDRILQKLREALVEIDRASEGAAALSLKYGAVISLTFMAAHSFGKQWTPLLANLRREGGAL